MKHKPQQFATYNDEIEFIGMMEERNRFVSNLACDLKGNVLVLFARVEGHGIPLYDMTKEKTNSEVHIIHGDIDVQTRENVRTIL